MNHDIVKKYTLPLSLLITAVIWSIVFITSYQATVITAEKAKIPLSNIWPLVPDLMFILCATVLVELKRRGEKVAIVSLMTFVSGLFMAGINLAHFGMLIGGFNSLCVIGSHAITASLYGVMNKKEKVEDERPFYERWAEQIRMLHLAWQMLADAVHNRPAKPAKPEIKSPKPKLIEDFASKREQIAQCIAEGLNKTETRKRVRGANVKISKIYDSLLLEMK